MQFLFYFKYYILFYYVLYVFYFISFALHDIIICIITPIIYFHFLFMNKVNGIEAIVGRILVSVVYSYDVIKQAAIAVQKQSNWTETESVKNLLFSSTWIKGLLTRANMRRRKITTEDKKIPSEEEILRIMSIGQDMYRDFGHSPQTVLNMDETAFSYAIGPEYMYCPPDQSRAQHLGIPNTKLRITAVVAVFGTGEFAPLFIIIKHSVSSADRPDQSGMTVITSLHKKDDGFGVSNGWDLVCWSKELCINNVTALHKCYYIIHKHTGEVITSQYKAWNDTVRMIMWMETVVLPLKIKLGKLMIWFDNCGCHKTNLVDNLIEEIGIQVACLPPNMTGILQVLDLVVNGPLKAHTRTLRGARIVDCFQKFKELYDLEFQKEPHMRKIIKFEVPKPDMLQGIQDLFDLMANGFREPKFVQGVVRSFISTGCMPVYSTDPNIINFLPYTKHKMSGTMNILAPTTATSESAEVLEAMYNMLDYDSDDEATAAMRYILDYNADSSVTD